MLSRHPITASGYISGFTRPVVNIFLLIYYNMDNDDFLADFSNDKNLFPVVDKVKDKEMARLVKDKLQSDKAFQKIVDKKLRKAIEPTPQLQKTIDKEKPNQDEETQLKEKHMLLKKIQEYHVLFPTETDELYKMIQKNKTHSVEKLRSYVMELDIIVSIGGGVDNYIVEMIYSVVEAAESVTKGRSYDISGLMDNLKKNSEFLNLTKKMILKYDSYIQTPLEIQLLMLVCVTTYITLMENKNIKK
jgi:hypothetical protein